MESASNTVLLLTGTDMVLLGFVFFLFPLFRVWYDATFWLWEKRNVDATPMF